MFGHGRKLSSSVANVFVFVFVAVLLTSSSAWAWVDRTFESDSVTLEIERDGSAVVSHEILLGIRGGPLAEIVLEPIDADAELLPEATATVAKSGSAAGWPLPLSAVRDASRVRLHVLEGKGLRSSKYLLRFRYRTNLAVTGKLHPGAAATSVEWSGIGFPDGIDSAKVVFRFPRGVVPPRLPGAGPDNGASQVSDDSDDSTNKDGVFLSTFRRGTDKDELEVVRPHVAKNEVVLWRVLVDRAIFDLAAPETAAGTHSEEVAPAPPIPRALPRRTLPRSLPFALGALAGLLYAAAVVLKARSVAQACVLRGANARPLLRLPLPLRAVVAALGVGGAVVLVLTVPFPSLAAACLLTAMAAATYLPPRLTLVLRGPGKWVELSADAAFGGDEPPLPGRFSDVGRPLGFVLFVACLMAFAAGAIVEMRVSPYRGVALALGSSVLFPLFFTGRSGELPLNASRAPRALLEWLMEALEKDASLRCHPIGRLPLGSSVHDELRLLILPVLRIQGVVAIEVGMDSHSGPLGTLVLPFVLVRVAEGMPAADILPKGLLWTRGRTADERVAVLRPKVPTERLLLELTRDVAWRLTVTKDAPRRQARTSAAKSAGSESSTANAGTSSSPLHAT